MPGKPFAFGHRTMKNIFILIILLGFIISPKVFSASEVTAEGSYAKALYKSLKAVMGETCKGDTCLLSAPGANCNTSPVISAVQCMVMNSQSVGGLIMVTGDHAEDLTEALADIQKPMCLMGMCTNIVGQIDCESEGKWFKNYKCRVITNDEASDALDELKQQVPGL
jgi:hypothetical protein